MAEQDLSNREEKWIVARAVLIPVLSFLVALLLIYTRSPPGDPGSTRWIEFPEILGGDNLRRALRTITVLFGLSSLPGGLIGIALGFLIACSSGLTQASLRFLRIGQWAPFLLWWPIALQFLVHPPPNYRISPYFFIWAIGIPAVALAACYHYLSARVTLGVEWRGVISEVARMAVLQGLFISVMLALSVWMEPWIIYPGMKGRPIHYATGLSLALFLLIVKWVYRSGFDYTAGVRREIFLANLRSRDRAPLWGAMLLVLLCLGGWQLLSAIGYPHSSLVSVVEKGLSPLISEGEIWKDVNASLFEMFAGVILSGVAALIVSLGLLGRARFRAAMLQILPFTYVLPIVLLPTWIGWRGLTLGPWTIMCVTVFSFFSLIQALWGLRDQPWLCRILLAADDELPYGFTAIIYGEMMNAVEGLGFVVVVAGATYQTDKGLAVFVLMLALLAGLSSTLRWIVKRLYFSEGSTRILLAEQ
jgi:ABC-type nitrate/sulfonate/bicarbonate transport system permease component